MADTKKPIAKKATEVKTLEKLREELTAKQNDLLESRRSHKLGELVNPRVLKSLRKDVARLLTEVKARELTDKESE
ncbi:MAG: 50S ribosomal protein L29 [Candidatus Saccharimonas sp.]